MTAASVEKAVAELLAVAEELTLLREDLRAIRVNMVGAYGGEPDSRTTVEISRAVAEELDAWRSAGRAVGIEATTVPLKSLTELVSGIEKDTRDLREALSKLSAEWRHLAGMLLWGDRRSVMTSCAEQLERALAATGGARPESDDDLPAELEHPANKMVREVLRREKQAEAVGGELSAAPCPGKGIGTMNAKIEACARAAHEANRAYCLANGDDSQPSWDDAPEWQRTSAIHGAEGVLCGNTPEQSHEGWLEEKRATGWKYGPVKDPQKKEHPCFVPYAELPPEQQHKDHVFVVVVGAMAKALGIASRAEGR